MSLTELIIAALAVWEIVEIYHHSHIAAGLRARAELTEGKLHTLLTCPFCMSPYVAWLVCALMLCVTHWLGTVAGWPALLPVYGLAVARLANLGNDVFHQWCRTPRANKEIPDLPDPVPAGETPKSVFEERIQT